MDDPLSIMREMEGRPARTGVGHKPVDKSRPKRGGYRAPAPAKSKQPRASERSSVAAQDWYDRGERYGFSFPYDVNYLALAIQKRVETDPRMKPLLDDDDKVDRWLAKINANWWDHYVDGTITASNAKEMFLGNDWDDVRDWAHSNLRKDYLVKHGRRVEPPIYANQQDYRERLESIHKQAQIDRYVAEQPEVGEPPELDPEGRNRLRSFANRRKRSTK